METILLRMFQKQVARQCQYLLLALNEVNSALVVEDIPRVFYGLQNFLNAAANISKAAFGGGGRRMDARKDLRESLGINDDSPLKDVAMRNNFEHFDERMERWMQESESHNFMDFSIGSRVGVKGLDDNDWFRHFNPKTGEMTFWGQDFNLNPLIAEAQRILPIALREAQKPH